MLDRDPLWTPEQRLIAAILIGAYRDVLTDIESRSESWADSAPVQQNDVDRAIRFLTDRSGPAARLRNHYCDLVGIDGDVLAERMRRMLDGDLPMPHIAYEVPSNPESRKRALARHAERVAYARARWFHLNQPTSTSRARSVRSTATVIL
ncbi:MAG: hypothetical protein LCH92_12485 [Proteobacteria bacterium]|nr:hypothetical protein [Pseudomonadota bacterium]